MGRLFWKILLSIWITMILTNVGALWIFSLMVSQSDAMPARIEYSRSNAQISAVSLVLEQKGVAATRALLKELVLSSPVSIFVIDDFGQEILGRDLSQTYLRDVRITASEALEPEADNEIREYFARQVVSSAGKHFTVIAFASESYHSSQYPSFARYLSQTGPSTQGPNIPLLRFGIAIFLSGSVSFLLAWYLTKPIRRLREAARRLAAGELSVRVAQSIGRRHDELSDLGTDFDHMAEQLQTHISKQKVLLQDISHELRSPLARMQVALGLARKKTSALKNHELDRIELETSRMESLIAQILTIARLEESDTFVLEEYIDIASLLKNIVGDAEYEARIHNCKVCLTCNTNPIMKANSGLLYSALENIIRNAVKYTAESTTVKVSLEKTSFKDGEIKISVCDRGAGVPEESLASLFEPFVRVGESRDRNTGGYGLGLAISKRAIRLHGGQISARNRRESGLCIDVNLPMNAEI